MAAGRIITPGGPQVADPWSIHILSYNIHTITYMVCLKSKCIDFPMYELVA